MGIPSLTSLMDENDFLWENYILRDCQVVLDGLSICHQLLNHKKNDTRFGGDYPLFASIVKTFIRQLRKANVEPLILFDGPLDRDGLKKRTQLERMKTKIASAKSLSEGRGSCVLPLFTRKVFVDVCHDLNVPILCCTGEADQLIAVAANTLHCPAISQDSDFFIFNLNRGYIPFDSVNWDCSDPQTGLSCRIYFTKAFTDSIRGLRPDVLPLFAIFAGNDLSGPDTFSQTLSPALFDKKMKSKKFNSKINPRHKNLIALLEWLASQSGLDASISSALKRLPQNERAAGRETILKLISFYQCEPLNSFDEVELKIEDELRTATPGLPSDMRNLYLRGLLDPEILRLWFFKEVRLPPLVENFDTQTVWKDCSVLRYTFYTLLFKFHLHETRISVTEMHRDQCNIATTKSCEETWNEALLALSVDSDNRRLLYQLGGIQWDPVEFSKRLPGWERFLVTVAFWVRNCMVSRAHFMALCCAAWLLSSDKPHILQKFSFIPDFTQKSDRYSRRRKQRNDPNKPKIGIIHSFAQFQAILKCFDWINTVMTDPFPPMRLEKIFNGHILYNLAREFEKTGQGRIATLLSVGDVYERFTKDFLEPVEWSLGSLRFQDVKPPSNRSKRKAKPKREHQLPQAVSDSDLSRDNSSDTPFRDECNIFTLLPQ